MSDVGKSGFETVLQVNGDVTSVGVAAFDMHGTTLIWTRILASEVEVVVARLALNRDERLQSLSCSTTPKTAISTFDQIAVRKQYSEMS